MSESTKNIDDTEEHSTVSPPIGWDGQTLAEMLAKSERRSQETGVYHGLETLEMKDEQPFEYEKLYSRLRGALVSARETALNISSSPIVREIGELCFQVYTPEGDCVALSTGIIVHVHTGSLAIKWMIEKDYEHEVGIEPGDIFCNNDTDIGNVHTTDIHTIVPVFNDGKLVAWIDGVTHSLDIGSMTRGHIPADSISRFDSGFHITCQKIGEDDERYLHWKEQGKRATRTPMYWDLDEKCRLAGCHMIRDSLKDIIDDVGESTFKQFMREATEEGHQIMLDRVQERLFPGTYRDVSFFDMAYEEEATRFEQQKDRYLHLPVEIELRENGELGFDMEGSSPPGDHPHNCSAGSMTGGLWVSLTQCLLHDGKVNDGSHLALDTNFPEGSVVNAQDPERSYISSWGAIQPTFNAAWQNLSRAFFARGFREEVSAGYGLTNDVVQGGGELQATGDYWPVGTFDVSCQGFGASAVTDGLDYGYAMFNPESDMGDVERWELTELGAIHLARQVKPNTAGHGKYRGGTGWEGVRTLFGAEDIKLMVGGGEGMIHNASGLNGGYPYAPKYSVRVHDTDLFERFQNQDPYPTGDSPPGTFESDIEGDVVRTDYETYFDKEFHNGDLIHWKMNGGPGYGDPLERPVEKVKEDVEQDVYTPDVVERIYGVVGEHDEESRTFTVDHEATEERREEIRADRQQKMESFNTFYERERQRVQNREFEEPTEEMYRGVFEVSEEWAEEFRDFWDLSETYSV